MNLKRIGLIVWLITICTVYINSQTIIKPNYALRSHETLTVLRVVSLTQKTVIFLSIENRIPEGYFCADKNIFIIYPDGTRSRLISSAGIPVCPETFKFKKIGEKLNFELTFAPLKQGTQWIDLVEECSEKCFSFYGICLNSDLNKKIEDASFLAEQQEPANSLVSFIKIANEIDSRNSGIEGLIYINIITLARETGNMAKAAEWYGKLKASSIPRRDMYIKYLNSRGVTF